PLDPPDAVLPGEGAEVHGVGLVAADGDEGDAVAGEVEEEVPRRREVRPGPGDAVERLERLGAGAVVAADGDEAGAVPAHGEEVAAGGAGGGAPLDAVEGVEDLAGLPDGDVG